MDGLKPEKFILSQFWKLEVQNPGISRVGPSGGSEKESEGIPMPLS